MNPIAQFQEIEHFLKRISTADYTATEAANEFYKMRRFYSDSGRLAVSNDRIIWNGISYKITEPAGRWKVIEL